MFSRSFRLVVCSLFSGCKQKLWVLTAAASQNFQVTAAGSNNTEVGNVCLARNHHHQHHLVLDIITMFILQRASFTAISTIILAFSQGIVTQLQYISFISIKNIALHLPITKKNKLKCFSLVPADTKSIFYGSSFLQGKSINVHPTSIFEGSEGSSSTVIREYERVLLFLLFYC